MAEVDVEQVLGRLRAAADRVYTGFPETRWARVAGSGPEEVRLHGSGGFHGLVIERGQETVLRCALDLPEETLGVCLAGDRLEGTFFSLFPAQILWNGEMVFSADGVPVAAGPALFTLIPELKKGDNGALELRLQAPDNQITPWFQLRLTTPSLRERFEWLDVGWAQLALAHALAVEPEEREAVERAVASAPKDLLISDKEALAGALRRMAEELAPLQSKASALKVHLIGHSHIDMNWLWTWPDTVEVIKRDFRSVLQLMQDFPELTFSHSQPATYEVIRREEPELFAQVLERIREGRWEPLTMTWIEGDTNLASGEAMARQLLEGVTYTRAVLGAEPSTFHAPDTFGHAGNLPQLAVSAGAVRYYHHRCNPGQENQWPAYWWQGQDGSRILGISTYSYNGEIQARDLAHAAIRAHRFGHKVALHFHGIGDHGGGPARQNLEALRRFQKLPLLPTAFCSTLANYTRELLEGGPTLPEWHGESSTIFEGCYTTHADTKRYNRHGENLLCTADTLAALAGQDHNAALREAWRTVLFNQFHDILDGSAIHEAYEKNAEDFAQVEATAQAVNAAALAVLEQGVEPGCLAVTNPLGWEREDWVVVEGLEGKGEVWLVGQHGHVTPGQYTERGLGFVARVPAFGTVSYRVTPEAPGGLSAARLEARPAFAPTDGRRGEDDPDHAPYLKVETSLFRIYVRRDCGILVSFYDKRVGRELVGYGLRRGSDYADSARPDLALNVFQLVEEHPHAMSAWHYDEVHTEHSLLRGATTTVVETGPVRCVLEVVHQIRSSTIKQKIIVYQDLPRVDFETWLDWQERGSPEAGVPNLKAAFTAHLPDCEAWFETPFAAVRRPADGQEVPALRWISVGGAAYGLSVINDSKYGHDVLGNRARITLVRSGYDPDSISDVGQHTIRYSLYPHARRWCEAGVVRMAHGFNQPLIARQVKAGSVEGGKPIFRPQLWGNDNVQVACLKRAHHGSGLVVRLYESAGRAAQVELSGLPVGKRVWETNIVEDRQAELEVRDGRVGLTFRPWQVRTVLIE